MTESNPPRGETRQPQSVVGPITLDKTRPTGTPFPVQPNSIVGPITLGITDPVGVVGIGCTPGAITLSVTSNGQPSRIVISGCGESPSTPAVTPGTELYAIARTDSDLVLLMTNGEQKSYVTFPAGTGTVTAVLTSGHVT